MNIQSTGNTDYIPHTIGIPRWCHTKLAYTTVYPGMGFDGFLDLTATFFFCFLFKHSEKGRRKGENGQRRNISIPLAKGDYPTVVQKTENTERKRSRSEKQTWWNALAKDIAGNIKPRGDYKLMHTVCQVMWNTCLWLPYTVFKMSHD